MDFFKNRLDIFPDRKELASSNAEELLERFNCIDFVKLNKRLISKKKKTCLGDCEVKWWQYISFCVIASEFLILDNYQNDLPGINGLSPDSQRKAKEIILRFNEYKHKGKNVIRDFSEINFKQLVEFAKSKKQFI